VPKSSSGIVRGIHAGPPFVLEVDVPGQGVCRLELAYQADAAATQSLVHELQQQSVEFFVEDGRPTVFFYRPVTEDGEVEYVAKVCLNVELARLSALGD
jgi:hypothetical protein